MPDPTPTREEREEARAIVGRWFDPQFHDALLDATARALAARRPAPQHEEACYKLTEGGPCSCEITLRPPFTEADVEAVLRAVPLIPSCNHELGICGTGEGTPDYPAMARAVLARLGGGTEWS